MLASYCKRADFSQGRPRFRVLPCLDPLPVRFLDPARLVFPRHRFHDPPSFAVESGRAEKNRQEPVPSLEHRQRGARQMDGGAEELLEYGGRLHVAAS